MASASQAITEVKPGQTWRWLQPNGVYRKMLVQSFTQIGGCRRANGIHPQSGKRMTVQVRSLEHGLHGAELLSTIEDYVYVKTPATRSGRW